MYQLTAHDKKPFELFGKPYWWSIDELGRLCLVAHSTLVERVVALNESVA